MLSIFLYHQHNYVSKSFQVNCLFHFSQNTTAFLEKIVSHFQLKVNYIQRINNQSTPRLRKAQHHWTQSHIICQRQLLHLLQSCNVLHLCVPAAMMFSLRLLLNSVEDHGVQSHHRSPKKKKFSPRKGN